MSKLKLFTISLGSIILLEAISYFCFLYPNFQIPSLIFVGVITLIASWKSASTGISIVIAELLVGSKGHLLNINIGAVSISLRLVIFLTVFFVWLIRSIQKKSGFMPNKNWWIISSGLIVVFIIGVFNAIFRHYPISSIFLDANGYLFFALFPVAISALREQSDWEKLMVISFAAWTDSVIKTFGLFFIFSHHIVSWMLPIYRWIRVTGVGEITQYESGVVRVFLQSHIYSVLFLCVGLIYLAMSGWPKQKIKKNLLSIFLILSSGVTLMSGSRSFWLGAPLSLSFVILLLIWKRKIGWKKFSISILSALGIFCGSILFLILLLRFPYPRPSSFSTADLLEQRTQANDVAAGSRMELLVPLLKKSLDSPIIGSGFGTTVTYHTFDPRALENNPSGLYTTYSFEWGWVDIALKFGALGLFVFIYLIIVTIRPLWHLMLNKGNDVISVAMFFGVLALVFIHTLTPFLNHPLGIGILILATAWGTQERLINKKIND